MDTLDHSASDLLLRAHELGFHAIAITLHDHVLRRPELFALAERLGILLIPSAEMRIEGADVVVLNISEDEALSLRKLADLRWLRTRRGASVLIFAPHPYYMLGGSIGQRVEEFIDCFDAIEYSHFHTRGLNLNRFAVRLAERYQKPLLATSDAHRLDFFGDHYSLVTVGSRPTIEELFDAIRAGRIERVSPAWPVLRFLHYLCFILVIHPIQSLLQKLQH